MVAINISDGMLTVARAKGVHSGLHRMELGRTLDFPDDEFAAAVAVGVFTIGHASPDGFHELLRVTRPGGHLVFNVNAEAYESGGFREAQEDLVRQGRWELMEKTRPFIGVPRRSPPIKTVAVAYRAS